MGLFYLLTLYCFIRGTTGHPLNEQSSGRRAAIWYALSVGACLLGMATREVMVSAPLIVLLYDRTFLSGTFRTAWKQRRQLYLALAATWILLGWQVASTTGRGGTAGYGTAISWQAYALTQCEAIPRYLWLSLWPHPLVLDYGTTVAKTAGKVLPFAAILALLVAASLIALWRRPVLGFVGAWFFAILAPSSSLVPVTTQTMAEHRMYLPLAAIITLAVAGLHALTQRRVIIVLLTAALGLGGLTLRRNEDYRSSLALWTDTVAKCPENARAHCNLGFSLFENGRLAEAIAHYERALQIRPDYPEAHNNLGNALAQTGRPEDAIGQFNEALRLNPGSAEYYYNRGNAVAQAGRLEDALVSYKAALRLKPDLSTVHNNLGSALARLGRFGEAAVHFQEAVRLDPSNGKASSNLGNALLELGRAPDAIASFEQALLLEPDSAETHFELGNALIRTGRRAEAIRQFEITLELRPDFAAAYKYLERLRLTDPSRSPRK
jgi:tetratricopeptide (TPR) repeat protein